MSKERVCILTSVHRATDIRIFRKQAVSLSKKYEVTILATGSVEEKHESIDFILLRKPRNRWERLLVTQPLMMFFAIRIKAKIYHFHDPELIPLGFVLRLMGRKVIYDIHEDTFKQIKAKPWIPVPVRSLLANTYRFSLFLASKILSGLICATEGIQDSIQLKSYIIRNYPIVGELSGRPGKNVKRTKVCYIGGIAYNRGLLEMTRFAESNPGRLVLAGPFQHESEFQMIQKEAGWKHLSYVGTLSREEIAELLQECYAGLVVLLPEPYFMDSLPIKMFEYMEAGVPVVASNFPLWEKILVESGCGICVDPTDAAEINQVLKQLETDSTLVQNMGNAGRETILERYNWDNEEKKLLQLYSELLSPQVSV